MPSSILAGLFPPAFISMPGPMEMVIILVVVLLIFGPKKLPEIGKAVGQTVKELKKASNPQEDQEAEKTGPAE